jgi:hypothetical protein
MGRNRSGKPESSSNQGTQGTSAALTWGGRLQSKGRILLLALALADGAENDEVATNNPADANATKASSSVYSRRLLRMDF